MTSANVENVVELMREADSYHKFWIEERALRVKADARAAVLANQVAELVAALMDVRARARFELEDPTPMRDTAFSLIEKAADAALAKVKS